MTTHIKGLTYAPKIPAVLNGTCRQTIRVGTKIKPGDKILFHGWEGGPYRSKWSWRKEVEVTETANIIVDEQGISFSYTVDYMDIKIHNQWDSRFCNTLAAADGIEPATGEALKEVLFKFIGVPGKDGTMCQIIRW